MDMENAVVSVDVARVLFGFAVQFHYLFVPLTLGLAALVAVLDVLAWRRGDAHCERASAFWGRFFLLNFACGVLTGWPLRYHIRGQWSEFAAMAQEVLDHVFGIEGRIAPVLLALVLAFAFRRRMPAGARALVSAALALALVAQSLAILALNAWMQRPADGRMVDGRFRLDDAWALFTNPLWPAKVMHTVSAAYVLGGVFVMAVSAWLLLRHRHEMMARVSLRLATAFTLVALGATFVAGHHSGLLLRQHQPAKFAAIEGLWEPARAAAPLTVLAWPDAAARTNRWALEVPGLLDWVAGDGQPLPDLRSIEQDMQRRLQAAGPERPAPRVAGAAWTLEQYQQQLGPRGLLAPRAREQAWPAAADIAAAAARAIPPVAPVFLGFRVMLAVWVLLVLLSAWMAWRPPDAGRPGGRRALWLCVMALPLPWLGSIAGWMVCEVGRQPWVVTGLLTTTQALGPVSPAAGALGILGWGAAYAAMLFANLLCSVRWIHQGPPPRRGPQPARRPRLWPMAGATRLVADAALLRHGQRRPVRAL
jgi:cytochrome d ubiquinol oxidase subunit I